MLMATEVPTEVSIDGHGSMHGSVCGHGLGSVYGHPQSVCRHPWKYLLMPMEVSVDTHRSVCGQLW